MSSIRSTITALNNGIQGFIKSSGKVLGGASDRLAKYLETENEIYSVTREIDIEQRTTSRVAEFMEFESVLLEKHGSEGITRINELKSRFTEKAQARLEKTQ